MPATRRPVVTRFSCGSCCGPGRRGGGPSAAAAGEVQTVGPAAVSRFVLHRLAALGSAATELARTVAVLGDDSELQLAGRVSGLSDDAARDAADDLVRADIFVARAPRVCASDRAGRAVRGSRARRAPGAARRGGRGTGCRGCLAGTNRRAPAADRPDGGSAEGRHAEVRGEGAAHRGAPRAAAARLRRALAESPAEQERAEILTELGRYEVATMQFEAAEQHLLASLESGAR